MTAAKLLHEAAVRTIQWRISTQLSTIITVLVLRKMLLLVEEEEEGEDYGVIGSYRKNPLHKLDTLNDAQKEYLKNIGNTTERYSKLARGRQNRYRTMTISSIIAASLIPFVAFLEGTGWAAAALGALAAILQSVQGILQDQKWSVEYHATSAMLSKALRKYELNTHKNYGNTFQKMFNEFYDEVEKILDAQGAEMLGIMRTSQI